MLKQPLLFLVSVLGASLKGSGRGGPPYAGAGGEGAAALGETAGHVPGTKPTANPSHETKGGLAERGPRHRVETSNKRQAANFSRPMETATDIANVLPRHADGADEIFDSPIGDPRAQAPWVATCRQRAKLDESRWGNCPDKPEPPLPEVATPLLRWIRAQQRVVLFGDSLMRDLFTMLVCLLIGVSPTARVTPPMSGAHFGLHGAIVLELPEGATLTFVWYRREFLPVNGSSPPALHVECAAVREAKVLFVNMNGAHQPSAAQMSTDMRNLVTWLQGTSPAQQRVVLEYAPAHFSGTPYGDYDASFFTRPASRGGATPEQRSRCAPHNASLIDVPVPPANNWRRSVIREVAAEYHLPLLGVWDMSARSHDDHTHKMGGGLKAGVQTDCRHWCNPGRTLLSWVDAILNLLPRRERPT